MKAVENQEEKLKSFFKQIIKKYYFIINYYKTKAISDNINENNQRNDLPSENEINKPIKSDEIRKNEINNYRSENSNNMEEPPAPGLFDEQF